MMQHGAQHKPVRRIASMAALGLCLLILGAPASAQVGSVSASPSQSTPIFNQSTPDTGGNGASDSGMTANGGMVDPGSSGSASDSGMTANGGTPAIAGSSGASDSGMTANTIGATGGSTPVTGNAGGGGGDESGGGGGPCSACSCVQQNKDATNNFKQQQADKTRALDQRNVVQQEDWLLNTVWLGKPGPTNTGVPGILPTLQRMTDELVDVGMYQAFAIGTMLDGQQQIDTQRLFNRLTARAEKDYQTDLGMCTFGTQIRSLPAAERRGEYVRYALSQRSQDRQLGHRNALGADGLHYDLRARMAQFRTRFCSKADNTGTMQTVCQATGDNAQTHDADINYAAQVDQPLTMNIDLTDNITDTGPTDPTKGYARDDMFALADNLYASDVLTRMGNEKDVFSRQENKNLLVDLRSIVAKRSVAENSFYSIVGMKSLGSIAQSKNSDGSADVKITSADSAKYIKPILKQLGVPDADQDKLIGKNPSYFAQMNVLTKMIYQRPEFYTDLYEAPANIERKSAAMTAVQLMQNFDLWESYLRQEAMMAVWLELDLKRYQDRVVNIVNPMQTDGQKVTPHS